MFDLTDVIDLHVHTGPDHFPRLGDDLQVAKACAAVGMKGMAVKCHFEPTAVRAHLVNQIVDDFTMYGGVTLNYQVGGINPMAVHSCLAMGGRVVWGPSGHSRYHASITGTLGGWGNDFMNMRAPEGAQGVTVFDEDDNLTDDAHEVINIVAEADALLATSHLSPREILAVLAYARTKEVRVLVNHVMYMPQCDVSFVQEIVRLGAVAEVCTVVVGGFWDKMQMSDVVRIITTVGPDNVVIASDAGGIQTPTAPESLRVFADNLIHYGVPEADVRRMLVDSPRRLLGI